MPIHIDVTCKLWAPALPGHRALARRAALAALKGSKRGDREVAILLADNATLRTLNKRFRKKDKPTNVLAFPDSGEPDRLGDIAIAFETTVAEAAAQEKSIEDHLAHLVVHGTLHLLGHDHERAAEARKMEALEVRILAGMGVADPYAGALAEAAE